jgi:choline kinase
MKVLITCAGVGSRLGNYTKYTNKSLVKVGDKFTINYIVDRYKYIENIDIIVILGYYGDFIKQYLKICYKKLKFTFITIDNYNGEKSSQAYSILQAQSYLQEPFIYHCCDTIVICDDKPNFEHNVIYVYKHLSSNDYTSINCDNIYVKYFNNKGALNYDYIYIGIGIIKDYQQFWKHLNDLYVNNADNRSLGDVDVYKLMLKNDVNIRYKIIDKWYDAGNVDIFNKSINKTNYNVLSKMNESISFIDDKVIKFFYDKSRNIKRVARYKLLQKFTPKIYDYSDNFHSMELIKTKPVSEICGDKLIYKLLNWAQNNLWISKSNYNINEFKNNCLMFYKEKTYQRVDIAINKKKLNDYHIINGVHIGSIYDILKLVDFNMLCDTIPSNFHGDFILDNVLYKDNKFYLIDWREDFGGNIELGDKYYDLAKLKHNIYLNHNNLENNLYNIVENIDEKSCTLDLKCNYFLINQIDDYDLFIKENKLNGKKINILMSLIWINMAPLHEYPLSLFLLNFGKYNLYNNLTSN